MRRERAIPSRRGVDTNQGDHANRTENGIETRKCALFRYYKISRVISLASRNEVTRRRVKKLI